MTDELLNYYEQELAYFRQVAPDFVRRHPDVAARLRMSDDEIDDPHVERLIQAFAFLNARTRRKIDDEFPEISQAMLQALYPHFLAPFPSAAIVRFALSMDQPDLVKGFTIPRGASLETEPIDGEPYRFRTCYPATLWPIELMKGGIHGPSAPLPATAWRDRIASVVRLELASYGRKVPIGAMDFERAALEESDTGPKTHGLRFFINAPPLQAYQLYENILNRSLGVVVSAVGEERSQLILDRRCIRPVGFGRHEALVESQPRSLPAYGLLTEYFVFPEKFLFFDLVGLDPEALRPFERHHAIRIEIYLSRQLESLEQYVGAQTFQLGCCPIVNLFPQRAASIPLTHHQTEYRVVPDPRRPRAYEIYSIDEVAAISRANEKVEFSPFYSLTHYGGRHGRGRRFWHGSRRPAAAGGTEDRTEIALSIVDADFLPNVEAEWSLDVMTTCLNPLQLPFGGGQPKFQLVLGGPLEPIACLTAPTKTCRPAHPRGALWRLISHLTLNHLSLISTDGRADPLREILTLYDVTNSTHTQNMIAGLLAVQARRTVGRPGGPVSAGVCRGLEVKLHFDEDRFSGRGLYLFGAIMERFLGMYCSINSFTRTVVTSNRRDVPVCEWPPRAGEMVFL
jgi:type VI secretion system protein ImpG